MANLSPLQDALAHLEEAAASVAEKVSAAVTTSVDSISQDDVDSVVSRVEGVAERLVGIAAPATSTSSNEAGPPAAAVETAAPADGVAGAGPAAWTPDKPAS